MQRTKSEERSGELLQLLQRKIGNLILESEIRCGDLALRIDRKNILDCFQVLKYDAELGFNMLVDLTAVDWVDAAPERFEVVYHLMNMRTLDRVRIKTFVPEEDPEVESVVKLWSSANFSEREAWDMYGVRFKNHPDLRRILMYDEFVGHPLRKDYPVQGKQPRVPMLSAEVRNTAVDMVRAPLLQINKKGARASGNGVSQNGVKE